MRDGGARRGIAAARRKATRLSLALALAASIPAITIPLPATAQQESAARAAVTVRASAQAGFGRLRFDFDQDVVVSARASNGVLVVRFDRPVSVREERLEEELPGFVSVVRRDPDGTGLRIALTRNVTPSVLAAGEIVFVDLLPEGWVGLPPGLPTDIVAELARRAREAEARFSAERMARAREELPLRVDIAELPGLSRLIFAPPEGAGIEVREEPGAILALRFDGRLRLETERPLGAVPGIARAQTDATDEALFVRLVLAEGFSARRFREDGSLVVDIDAPPAEEPIETSGDDPMVDPIRAALELFTFPELIGNGPQGGETVARGADDGLSVPDPAPPGQAQETAAREPARTQPLIASVSPALARMSSLPGAQRVPASTLTASEDGLALTLGFARPAPAAAFLRGNTLFAVFQSDETPELPHFGDAAQAVAQPIGTTREGPFVTYRFALAQPRVTRLVPADDGWALLIGQSAPAVPRPLEPVPVLDDDGRSALRVPLEGASAVHWITPVAGGERLAIVTAAAPARNLDATRRFAELALLPTAHGLVVSALADDVMVRVDLDGVLIGRSGGLAVSGTSAPGDGAGPEDVVLERGAWTTAQRGSPLATYRAAVMAVTQAPRDGRSAARLELALALLANGLSVEAAGVLGFAAQEDPALLEDPRLPLLRGIAAARRHRLAEAEAHLGAAILAEDAEAALWRAYIDMLQGRPEAALGGFRRAESVLDLYADDLQGRLRLAAARAGIEGEDLPYAEGQLAALRLLHPGSYAADEAALVHALANARGGRPDEAMHTLSQLAREASRPVAAQAELARIRLGLQQGTLSPQEAIAALEALTISWRGDDVEVEGLGMLGRLYAAAGRWREAFFTAHTANLIFPDHPVTVDLHEDTARVFDELFLAERAADLDEVETVALFFDFKEFLPIGRRGDEIVRRLSDRLVALGLLDKATELLGHQVENRLDGAGRAAVAARLATIHLMDQEPMRALEVLTATRIAELPNAVRHARTLLEARALSDLSRTDLALEVIADETGPEIERLRADILWTGRRWREAGEAHEALAGTAWREDRDLAPRERRDVLRAALAYALDRDAMALDRLRAKFAERMRASEDSAAFAVLSDAEAVASAEFRRVARRIAVSDTLADFLAIMRARYPEVGVSAAPRPQEDASSPLPDIDLGPDLPEIGEISSL